MFETELKLQVPEEARRAVDAAVRTGVSRRERLQATYFDTQDRRLAAAGLSLRLRKEGRRWLQTLKAAGPNLIQRLEHNVPLVGPMAVPAGTVPGLDPRRHSGTPVGDLLAAALEPRQGEAALPRLSPLFSTDIWRRTRTLRAPGGYVELAFDSGEIVAADRRWPIAELEIELVRGRPGAVIDVARRWVRRHGLWLDGRSKAERGDRLARHAQLGPVVKAETLQLDRSMSCDDALHAVLANCLRQILPNASEMADGRFAEEHLHQLRVGLRRLRSALRFFDGWTAPIDPSWDERLAALFGQLGATRDRDALAETLLPELRAAGAPLFELPSAPFAQTPTELVRTTETTLLFLDLLAWQIGSPPKPALPSVIVAPDLSAGTLGGDASHAPEPTADERLASATSDRLQLWHRQALRAAKRYAKLDDDARHRLRKRFKRLRYAAEFAASLYRGKDVKRYLKGLQPVQDSLGRYNDLRVGLDAYRAAVGDDPRAWFAIGWLTARRDLLLAESTLALKGFARCKPFWTGR